MGDFLADLIHWLMVAGLLRLLFFNLDVRPELDAACHAGLTMVVFGVVAACCAGAALFLALVLFAGGDPTPDAEPTFNVDYDPGRDRPCDTH